MPKKTAHDPLLAECEPYFLDGLHTVAQIARRTQEVVREAVDRHWELLVRGLGFDEDGLALLDYWDPDRLQKTKPTDNVFVGTKLKVSGVFEAGVYRYWAVEDKETGIGVYTWIKGRDRLGRLSKKIDDLPDEPPEPVDSWCFYSDDNGTYEIVRLLADSDIGQLSSRLDELITYYVTVTTKIGGIKGFLA